MTETATMNNVQENDAQKIYDDILQHAESIRNDEQNTVGTMSLGDVVRQGDIYIVKIASLPKSVKPRTNPQLVPGDTQGSRHTLVGGFELYDAEDKQELANLIQEARKLSAPPPVELLGPVFKTKEKENCVLAHPEHGDHILPPGEICAAVSQRAFADEVRRQMD